MEKDRGDKNILDGGVIRLRWLAVILIIAVTGLVVSNATGSARVDRASTDPSLESLTRQYQKRLARLRARMAKASEANAAGALRHADACFAATEEIAHKKILDDLRRKEQVEMADMGIDSPSIPIQSFICSRGLSEEEVALLESELDSQLADTASFKLQSVS